MNYHSTGLKMNWPTNEVLNYNRQPNSADTYEDWLIWLEVLTGMHYVTTRLTITIFSYRKSWKRSLLSRFGWPSHRHFFVIIIRKGNPHPTVTHRTFHNTQTLAWIRGVFTTDTPPPLKNASFSKCRSGVAIIKNRKCGLDFGEWKKRFRVYVTLPKMKKIKKIW